MPTDTDSAVLDIVRNRATFSKRTHLRIAEIQDLCFARFGADLSGDQVKESVKRLARRRLLRWVKVNGDDVFVLP